jgi:mono/diheme cytochrome c family protein
MGCYHCARNHMPSFATTRLIIALFILSVTLLLGCAHPRNLTPISSADPGRIRFETHCAGCHLNEGPYMMGEAPPLEGSSWVAGPENRVIKIVLHGLHGPIEVRSQSYNQEMPGFAPILTDADIASLLSYVRRRFGGASTPTSEAAVTQIRAANQGRTQYWTVLELMKEP